MIGQLDPGPRRISDRAALLNEKRQLVQVPNTALHAWADNPRTQRTWPWVGRRMIAIASPRARIESRQR